MLQRELEITNKLGLHARASAKLTQVAARFESGVWITRNGRRVNAKSIMGVMMLAASKGTSLILRINGTDEMEAASSLEALVLDKFGEPE